MEDQQESDSNASLKSEVQQQFQIIQHIHKYEEPDECLEVTSLVEDNESIKDLRPIDQYLQHCQVYSQRNLQKDSIEVQNWYFKDKDFQFLAYKQDPKSKEVKQFSLMSQILAKQIGFSGQVDEKFFDEVFENDLFRIFKNVIYVDGQQQLVLKTWEKYKIKIVSNSQNQIQDFYIKTIRCYDRFNDLKQLILVEMINQGTFDPIRFYDVSFQYFQNHIYYFKRIRQTIQKSPTEIEEKTFLRLYRLNVKTFEESDCFLKENVYYEIAEPDGCEFNSIFSQEFGKVQQRVHVGIRQPKNEKEFLQTLFLTLQKFVKESEANQISIVRVLDMKQLLLVNPDKNTLQADFKNAPVLQTRQIQQVNHILEFIPIDKLQQESKSLGGLIGGQSTP